MYSRLPHEPLASDKSFSRTRGLDSNRLDHQTAARIFSPCPRQVRLEGLFITILLHLGFKEVRQRGSHKQFRHHDGRDTTVPVHKGRDISPLLLRRIADAIGLTVEEFLMPDHCCATY